MVSKKYIFIIPILMSLSMLLILLCDKKISLNLKLENDLEISDKVYVVSNLDNLSFVDLEYQKNIEKLIYNKKNDRIYNANNPLMILNPYGTNVTGLYIYFSTFFRYKVEYTISVEDVTIPDFTNTLSGGLTQIHEGHIIGLIQGVKNILSLKLINNNNEIVHEYNYEINVPEYNTNSIRLINSKIMDDSKISDGLYMIININNFDTTVPLSFYDKYGVLRAEFTKESGSHSHRPIFIDDKFLYSIDRHTYALINKFGKIEKIYPIELKNSHDYIYSEHNNSLLYFAGNHYVKKLDLKTGEDIILLDFSQIMESYWEASVEYYKKNNENVSDDDIDWIHPNSIEIVNDNDLILSFRENSSIVYISDIYHKPCIKYIIAPERIYDDTEYKKYLLKQIGNFPIHAGQHTVILENDKNLKDGQYYLYFFNNNFVKSNFVYNSDWVNTIKGVGTVEKAANNSMYYKYLIDEKNKTFMLVDSFNLAYSNAKSNVQIYKDGHYISTSGKKSVIQEFDADKNLLLELRLDILKDIYRAYKVDMKDFWFGSSYQYTDDKSMGNNFNSDQFLPSKKEENNSDFYYNKKINTILGINTENKNSSESDLIYYDNIYFTIYDYHTDTLIIPSSINGTEIKKITGINYANVKKIIIEEGIEEIGDYAFLGCKNLKEIVLPSTLKKIGKYSFVLSNNIKIINIPDSVKYIGREAFKGWNENQTINVIKNWEKFSNNWDDNSQAVINKGVK